MKKLLVLLIAGLCGISARAVFAEWQSIDGKPVQLGDIIEVELRDLHPTEPVLGFDRIYYKLGRYAKDPRKVFDEYCETNGRKGIRDFTHDSNLHDPSSFACLEAVGTDRVNMKTVVIAPNGNLYLTDGHHTFNVFWIFAGGGPDVHADVVVSRDYRNLKTMDDFWEQMRVEKNIWLFDENDRPITVEALPTSLGLENFKNDPYRGLMYFTRRIAWKSPGEISVPDPKFFGDDYPDVPFVEFYWMREIRGKVNLVQYDLNTLSGYVAAIEAVGEAIINVRTKDVGGSGLPAADMGQFSTFNRKELARISRPGTGKLAYMLSYKSALKKKTPQK